MSSDQIKTDGGQYVMSSSVETAFDEIPVDLGVFSSFEQSQPVLASVKSSGTESQIIERTEWTPKLESKFTRLAERKALSQLSLPDSVEFERLVAFRRQLKNPRTGEEVIAEYEQRAITRNLVQVLTQYVTWHKRQAANNSR